MEYYDFRAMNTDIVMAADGAPERASMGFMAARAFIAAEETRFTRFSPNSELARLNRATGEWFTVSPQMFSVLQQMVRLIDQTDGLFSPCILSALEMAGYDRSMEVIRAQGAQIRPTFPAPAPLERCQIELDPAKSAVRLASGARIDLGGIAKSWIAESAAYVLAEYSEACVVNAGGDLFAIGLPQAETSWSVALEDPRDSQAILAVLHVGPGAVTTSSITKRSWIQNGRLHHHLIDPRTGLPAQTDWLSVTVIAASATLADVFAKALLIAGSRDARQIAESHKDIEFIGVDGQGRLWGSERAKEYLDVNHESTTI
jgi:thiamine biosynthesis lipoprotein